jgi:putative hemolysin
LEGNLWFELVFIALLIMLNGFFAAAEIALISVRKSRLKELAQNGNRQAAIILNILEDPSRLFATIQIGVTFVGFLASAIAAVSTYRLLAEWISRLPLGFLSTNSRPIAVTLVTVIVSFFTLIFGELSPKNIALKHAEPIALLVADPLNLMAKVARPAIWLLARSSDLVLSLFGIKKVQNSQPVTEDEIRALLRAGHEQGLLDRSETEMIHGIFELGETTVREVMVPRIDLVTAEDSLTLGRAQKLMDQSGHSRLPVYHQTVDNIVGFIHDMDLNRALKSRERSAPVADIVRPAHFVPDSKKLDSLLKDFQDWKTHSAIVVDEYGGTAGMVTLDDVLEEIVGDIRDEFDTELPHCRRVDDRTCRIDARMDIEELNEALGTDFPTEGYETFGGFILDIAGKVPAVGEKLRWPPADPAWEFVVENVSRRRIMAVRAKKIGKTTAKAAAPKE